MSDSQNDTILIVEPDPDLQAIFEAHFQATEDFRFQVITNGAETLDAVLKVRPKLILMEVQLPDIPGLVVFRDLQQHSRSAHIPVIFLASGTEIILRNQALEAGAYDFIEKPIDVAELGLRIRNTLSHSHQEGLVHPQTRLPTERILKQAIEKSAKQGYYSLMKLTIENFGVFREIYGFVTASEIIIFVGNVLSDIVTEVGLPEDFIGHASDAEFVIVTKPERVHQIYEQIQDRLNSQLLQFHNFIERDQGYMEISDEAGGQIKKPLINLAVHISRFG